MCGDLGGMQWIEARSHRRNDVPMRRGKAHVDLECISASRIGDSSREKGETQKFLESTLTSLERSWFGNCKYLYQSQA